MAVEPAPNFALSRAALNVAEALFDILAQLDREALKRMLDDRAAAFEAALSRPPAADGADALDRLIAAKEISLLRRLFDSLGD